MKGFVRSKKGVALLATLVVAAVAAVGAYAFFANSSPTNPGSATAASSITPWVVTSLSGGSNLWPGASNSVDANLGNTNSGPLGIGKLVVTITGATGGCNDNDFQLVNNGGLWVISGANNQKATVTGSPLAEVPAGATWDLDSQIASGLQIKMLDTNVDQSACVGQTIGLNLAVS
jgi:hypothetical protein